MKNAKSIPDHLTDEDVQWWAEVVAEMPPIPKVRCLLGEALRAQRETVKRWDDIEAKAKRRE